MIAKIGKALGMKKILCILGAVPLIAGLLIFVLSDKSSLGIIGGADGSTAFFISGKAWVFPLAAGILLIIASCLVQFKKKK